MSAEDAIDITPPSGTEAGAKTQAEEADDTKLKPVIIDGEIVGEIALRHDSKFTPKNVACFEKVLLTGGSRRAACDYIGISRNLFYRWMDQKKGFSAMVLRAEAKATTKYAAIIDRAAEGGQIKRKRRIEHKDGSVEEIIDYTLGEWQAAAWKLERLNPEEYGERRPENYQRTENDDLINRVFGRIADLVSRADEGGSGAEVDGGGVQPAGHLAGEHPPAAQGSPDSGKQEAISE